MLKKFISMSLIIVLVNLTGGMTTFANPHISKEERLAAKVKDSIRHLGTGKSTKIRVKLKDKTEIQGYVSEIKEDSFIVADADTGQSTEVPYSQVRKVKGNNFSTGAKIAIGVGLAVAILVIVALANGGADLTCSICP